MMKGQIVVIDGHPDPEPGRLCHALADAFVRGAEAAGHGVELVRLAELDIQFFEIRGRWLQAMHDLGRRMR